MAKTQVNAQIVGIAGAAANAWTILRQFIPATAGSGAPPVQNGPLVPANWSKPQLYSMTVTEVSQDSNADASSDKTTTTVYFFDGVVRAEHVRSLVATKHPVQAGASITDHLYRVPDTLVLDIFITDIVASFKAGQYSSTGSRSVSAFQTFQAIADKKLPLTLNTRLRRYDNMALLNIKAAETRETRFSLKATMMFEEILSGTVTSAIIQSSRPNQTGQTNEGTKQNLSVAQSLLAQHKNNKGVWTSQPAIPGLVPQF